jgi:membrane-bound lytic murein transglycosylase B
VTHEDHLQWFDAGDAIRETIVGIVAGMALGTDGVSAGKPIVAFAEEMADEHGFDQHRVMEALSSAEYQQEIIDAISSPAEALPWHRYRPIFLTDARIDEGVEFWAEHEATLREARERFDIPERIMVAIIGVESRYGRHRGRYRVIDALRTLAFGYPPRSAFFRRELKAYFLLAREEGIDLAEPHGSYAGAMGIPQFISSSYRAYAIDLNDNGRRDLWDEMPDIIGSVANYFHRHGWQPDAPIVDRVTVSGKRWQPLIDRDLRPRSTVAELREAGVNVPAAVEGGRRAKLLELEGPDGPEYFAAYRNFYVITRYNHSPLYAMAVHQLGRAIAERRNAE